MTNLAAGDQYQIRLYEKTRAADGQVLYEEWIRTGGQSKPGFTIPSMVLMHGWDITIKKLTGTDRTITWSIRQVA